MAQAGARETFTPEQKHPLPIRLRRPGHLLAWAFLLGHSGPQTLEQASPKGQSLEDGRGATLYCSKPTSRKQLKQRLPRSAGASLTGPWQALSWGDLFVVEGSGSARAHSQLGKGRPRISAQVLLVTPLMDTKEGSVSVPCGDRAMPLKTPAPSDLGDLG